MSPINNDLESDLETGSQEESQSSDTSKKSDSQTSSPDAAELWKQLEPLIDRKFQSVKDKTLSQQGKDIQALKTTVEGFQPVLERVKGLIPAEQFNQLQRDLEFEAMKERVYGTQPAQSSDSPAGKQTGTAASEVSQIVDSVLDLPGNDPRVTDLKIRHGNDPKAYLQEALKLYAKIGTKDESTPGEQPPLAGGGTSRKVENPIQSIDDPHTLYKLAAQQMEQQIAGKKRRVAS